MILYEHKRLTSRRFLEYTRSNDVAIFPVGALHAHEHIPMGIDILAADAIADDLARRTSTLLVPQMPFGTEPHYVDYPGTIHVPAEHLKMILLDVCAGLKHWGIRKIVFVNGHGGNGAVLRDVAADLRSQGMLAPIIEWWILVKDLVPEIYEAPDQRVKGDTRLPETALALAIDEDSVEMDQCRAMKMQEDLFGGLLTPDWFKGVRFKGVSVPMPLRTFEVANPGELGSTATREQGEELLEAVVSFAADFVETLKKVDIPPLPSHQS